MSQFRNAMEVFKLLEKSNCRECGEKTCLAFAGAVFQDRRALSDCPRLDGGTVERLSGGPVVSDNEQASREALMAGLVGEAARADFAEAAARLGGTCTGNRLTLKVLGKDFSIDSTGKLFSDIHVNPWVVVPFLKHVLYGQGRPPSGKWVSLRDLKNGRELYPLFRKRCEESMKRAADIETDLFDAIIHMFSGREVEKQFESDVSVVLHPLPLVPVMICYWLPEDGMESTLGVYFDETMDVNSDVDSAFMLGAGLAQMFVKLSQTHGFV